MALTQVSGGDVNLSLGPRPARPAPALGAGVGELSLRPGRGQASCPRSPGGA